MMAAKETQSPEMAEYVEALETAAPAWFVPTSIDEFKRYLAVLIREHVRACYRSQFEAAAALGTTQGRVSMAVTGTVEHMTLDSLVRMAMAAGLIKRVEVEVE